MDRKVFGVIPARGGSKGILRKNIRFLHGKPLLAYTIEAAHKSLLLSDFLVSTDSEEIASVAQDYGAPVLFPRPADLATDTALSLDVVKHALLDQEKKRGVLYDVVLLLQPTTPFRTAEDIDDGLELLFSSPFADSVVSVVDTGAQHPARMYTLDKDLMMIPVMKEKIPMCPRQELPKVYIRNGAIYATWRKALFEKNSLIGDKPLAYVMPSQRSVNIDNESDWQRAESILQNG